MSINTQRSALQRIIVPAVLVYTGLTLMVVFAFTEWPWQYTGVLDAFGLLLCLGGLLLFFEDRTHRLIRSQRRMTESGLIDAEISPGAELRERVDEVLRSQFADVLLSISGADRTTLRIIDSLRMAAHRSGIKIRILATRSPSESNEADRQELAGLGSDRIVAELSDVRNIALRCDGEQSRGVLLITPTEILLIPSSPPKSEEVAVLRLAPHSELGFAYRDFFTSRWSACEPALRNNTE